MLALGLDIGTSKICVSVIDGKTGNCRETFETVNDTFITVDEKQTDSCSN